MIGILLALQVNNWNENRKKDSLEIEYLIGIKQDIEADIPQIERRISTLLKRMSTLHKIDSTFIPVSLSEFQDISLDSVDLAFIFSDANLAVEGLVVAGCLQPQFVIFARLCAARQREMRKEIIWCIDGGALAKVGTQDCR